MGNHRNEESILDVSFAASNGELVTGKEYLDDFIKAFNLPTDLDYNIAQELLRLIAQGHNIENAVAAIQGVDAIHVDGID